MRPCPPAYVIADDFTGAASIGGELASLNMQTILYRRELPSLEAAEAVVLDTASRHLPDGKDHQLTARAMQRMSQVAGSVVLKKIDSRLQGEVRTDLRAFLSAFDGRVLVAAACPMARVRTESGCQRNDAGVDIDLMELMEEMLGARAHLLPLEVVASGPEVVAKAIDASPARLIVADAITQQDLNDAVHGARDAGVRTFIGTYGLGQAVGRSCTPAPTQTPHHGPTTFDRVLMIVGSISDTAQSQVKSLLAGGAHEVVVDPDSSLDGSADAEVRRVRDTVAASTAPLVVLHTQASVDSSGPGRRPAGRGLSENELAHALAPALTAGVRAMPQAGIVITGGETAGSLATSLGWEAFDVLGEYGPGIASCRTRQADRRYVVTKPGAFGDASTLSDLAQRLLGNRTDRGPNRMGGRSSPNAKPPSDTKSDRAHQ